MPVHRYPLAFILLTLCAAVSCAPLAAQTPSPAPRQMIQAVPPPAPSKIVPPPASETSSAAPPAVPLTLRQRFVFELKDSFGPSAFIIPAFGAAYTMAHPPARYSREWTQGPGAFARNYGSGFGENTVGGFTRFATAAIDREDPRYFASVHTRFASRVMHAVAFTVADRADSGHRVFALSSFTGAAAAGFVGMAWEPDGFDDYRHAIRRGSFQLATYAVHNLFLEFTPEISTSLHKIHLLRH